MDIEGIVDSVFLYELTRERADHSRRTAEYARFLAKQFDGDEEKAFLAGLCHDLAKEKKREDIIRLAELYRPEEILEDERQLPLLLHGRAAAGLLRERLDFQDDEILDGITWHITGKVGMSQLAKIVYCADYLEPGRSFIDDSFRSKALSGDIDYAVKAVVESLLIHRKVKKHNPCVREKALMLSFGLGVDW